MIVIRLSMVFVEKGLTDFIFCVYNEKNEILR